MLKYASTFGYGEPAKVKTDNGETAMEFDGGAVGKLYIKDDGSVQVVTSQRITADKFPSPQTLTERKSASDVGAAAALALSLAPYDSSREGIINALPPAIGHTLLIVNQAQAPDSAKDEGLVARNAYDADIKE